MLQNDQGQTALSQACLNNDKGEVRRLIKEYPGCVFEQNWNQSLAAHVAVKFSTVIIVKMVLMASPVGECDIPNQYGHFVGDYAANRGRDHIDPDPIFVKYLISTQYKISYLINQWRWGEIEESESEVVMCKAYVGEAGRRLIESYKKRSEPETAQLALSKECVEKILRSTVVIF